MKFLSVLINLNTGEVNVYAANYRNGTLWYRDSYRPITPSSFQRLLRLAPRYPDNIKMEVQAAR